MAGAARLVSRAIDTHSGVQDFFFDENRMLRRHDYNVNIAGGFPAAQLTTQHVMADGISLPTRRRAYTRRPRPAADPRHADGRHRLQRRSGSSSTEQPVGEIALGTSADVDAAVAAARRAFSSFSRTTRQERLELLNAILGGFASRRQDLADALVEELGAPAQFAFDVQTGTAFGHLMTGIEVLKTYAFEQSAGPRTAVRREPIGVVGMITPWNWPINQIMCKVVPALATGNTMVHKPSEFTPFSAHIIAEILHEAGVPAGVYNLVDGDGPTVGAAISAHPHIDMVSFTGSTAAGVDVARRAAETVKRVHQELGGKSPNIVLPDADLEKAVTENLYRLLMNSGQSCHAPTRLLAPKDRIEEVKAIAARVAASIPVGDPKGGAAYLGPVVSERQWNRIQDLIRQGMREGATLVTGGEGRPRGWRAGTMCAPRSSPMSPTR